MNLEELVRSCREKNASDIHICGSGEVYIRVYGELLRYPEEFTRQNVENWIDDMLPNKEKDRELIAKLEIYLEALKERDITCFGQDFLDILAYITDKVTMSFDNFNRVCDHLSVRLQGISSSGPKDIDEFYSEKNEKINAIIKKLNIK